MFSKPAPAPKSGPKKEGDIVLTIYKNHFFDPEPVPNKGHRNTEPTEKNLIILCVLCFSAEYVGRY